MATTPDTRLPTTTGPVINVQTTIEGTLPKGEMAEEAAAKVEVIMELVGSATHALEADLGKGVLPRNDNGLITATTGRLTITNSLDTELNTNKILISLSEHARYIES